MRLCRRLKVALATLLSFYEDGRIRNLLEISLIRFIFTIYSFFRLAGCRTTPTISSVSTLVRGGHVSSGQPFEQKERGRRRHGKDVLRPENPTLRYAERTFCGEEVSTAR